MRVHAQDKAGERERKREKKERKREREKRKKRRRRMRESKKKKGRERESKRERNRERERERKRKRERERETGREREKKREREGGRKREITSEMLCLLQDYMVVAVPGLEVVAVLVRGRSLWEAGIHGLEDMDLAYEAGSERSWKPPPREVASVPFLAGDE